jgi:Transposase DNA-binding/Transposase Tn5 dimerisation domain
MTIGSLDVDCWAAQVAEQAELPDDRLNQRLADILAMFARRSADSIPQACPTPAATKATYRFLSNHRVTVERLHDAIAAATVEQCRGRATVLAVHDTTSLNYSAFLGTRGLGPIGSSGTANGLCLHSTLALRSDGVALGLLHQECWRRSETKRTGHNQAVPLAEKESCKWLFGVRGGDLALEQLPAPERPRVIHLMDREGDIHDVLEALATTTDGCVIRSTHNRVIDGPIGRAHTAVAQAAALGDHTIDVPRQPGRPPRQARLQLRAVTVTVQPRHAYAVQAKRQPFTIQLVEAREVDAPPATALHWLLWTTEPARTCDDAVAVVRLYRQRWKIEDFHLTLKSGCRIEALALETADRLSKAVVIYSAVAAHLLAMRDVARVEPEAPCTTILSDDAWKALWMHIHQTPLTANVNVPTIRQAVLWIGRLGGHLNRKHDGMPGVRTLWRGYRDLNILVRGYRLARTTFD